LIAGSHGATVDRKPSTVNSERSKGRLFRVSPEQRLRHCAAATSLDMNERSFIE
jgi:hypothetical protein